MMLHEAQEKDDNLNPTPEARRAPAITRGQNHEHACGSETKSDSKPQNEGSLSYQKPPGGNEKYNHQMLRDAGEGRRAQGRRRDPGKPCKPINC